MLKYKLTDQYNTTCNNTLWGENITHETNGEGELCSKGWLHYYHTPELAVLMNPFHANIDDPKLWECEAEGVHKDNRGLKGGCTRLTTLREIELPVCSVEQRVEFGIRCALEVHKEEKFVVWANNWLNGVDRSRDSAANASRADAAYTAVDAVYYAARASYASAAAANASAYAAYVVSSADASYAAASYAAASYAAYVVSSADAADAVSSARAAGLAYERLTEIAKQVVSS